ncbi:MAG: hypothetical protein CME04_19680 [Gemmatimonadaceae bacterium]|jgi:cbb3-type cytochrome oxidase subunit 3|nr:hypothetical protein [Gemmatimonadaceae bacterium]|tara:strand:- start:146 stop:448 length:303 start_codon:yes stop_codon:yes gene_type:complete
MAWILWGCLLLCGLIWSRLETQKRKILQDAGANPAEMADRYTIAVTGRDTPFRRVAGRQHGLLFLSILLIAGIFWTQGWVLGLASVAAWYAVGIVAAIMR